MLLTGCAHFEHQTNAFEPHGLVEIVKSFPSFNYAGEVGVVKTLDGLAVSTGHTYRVKPGEHAVVIKSVETVSETFDRDTMELVRVDSSSGAVLATEFRSFSDQGCMSKNRHLITVNHHYITYTRNSLSVQVGWRYALDGDRVVKTQFQQQTTKPRRL